MAETYLQSRGRAIEQLAVGESCYIDPRQLQNIDPAEADMLMKTRGRFFSVKPGVDIEQNYDPATGLIKFTRTA